jgi:hypothetical protein
LNSKIKEKNQFNKKLKKIKKKEYQIEKHSIWQIRMEGYN